MGVDPDEGLPAGRKLTRSTVETWLATAIGIFAAAVPVTWWLEAFLLLVVAGLVCDLALHSPLTATKPTWQRAVTMALGLTLIVAVGAPSILQRFHEARHPTEAVTKTDLTQALRQPPRLVVSQIVPLRATPDDDIRFNVTYANQGQAPVAGLTPHFGIGITGGALDRKAEDKLFVGFARMTKPARTSSDLIQPGETRFSTLPSTLQEKTGITSAKLRELQAKKMALYFILNIFYRDARDGSLWETQLCQYWDFNIPKQIAGQMAPHMCTGHNGVFRASE